MSNWKNKNFENRGHNDTGHGNYTGPRYTADAGHDWSATEKLTRVGHYWWSRLTGQKYVPMEQTPLPPEVSDQNKAPRERLLKNVRADSGMQQVARWWLEAEEKERDPNAVYDLFDELAKETPEEKEEREENERRDREEREEKARREKAENYEVNADELFNDDYYATVEDEEDLEYEYDDDDEDLEDHDLNDHHREKRAAEEAQTLSPETKEISPKPYWIG